MCGFDDINERNGIGLRPVLRFCDLAKRLRAAPTTYRMAGGSADGTVIVLEGKFGVADFHAGLRVHVTDAVEQRDGSTEIVLQPALSVSVLLEGDIDATLDDRPFRLGRHTGGGNIWVLTRPARLRRQTRRGRKVRKVNVSVTPQWLRTVAGGDVRENPRLQAFLTRHLARADWSPAKSTVRYAEEILAGHDEAGVLSRLSLEIRALAILRDALSVFEPRTEAKPAEPRDHGTGATARARTVRDFVDAHLADDLTLGDIARATGMSVSTLQRVFKATFGVTVIDHLRICRLDLARKALSVDGLSIQQAAHLARYSSAANFATAFKRQFGFPPSDCRGPIAG